MLRTQQLPTTLLATALALTACSGPNAAPRGPVSSPEAEAGQGISTVLETIDGGGYTYARIAQAGGEIWVAGPLTPLAVGETVTPANLMAMGSFHSPTLNRTFDELYFADSFQGGQGTVPTPQPAPSTEGSARHQGGGSSTIASGAGVVEEVIPASGYVYLQVSTDRGTLWLAGPSTAVTKGQRVEWSGEMMMRNFQSQTLGRTFEELLFVNALRVAP